MGIPFRLRLETLSTFSFSSCSKTLGAGLALTAVRDILVLTLCSEFTDDTLRCKVGVVTAGLADDDRESKWPFAEGVGVPTVEGRDFKGGGPIELSIPARTTDLLAEDDTDELPPPLTRVLFPRARSLADGGAISEETFRSFFGFCMASVPESESADGGRDCIGVAAKTEESRR